MWQGSFESSLSKEPAVACHLSRCIYLKERIAEAMSSPFSRQMKNKINTLLNCHIHTEDGRNKASRAAKSIGERAVTELLIKHQDPHSISSHLWTAVRARGCQFLGPAMQEEVLKLVLLSLEEGTALARKTLVLYVVQKISPQFPLQASKTAIGHVIQILYRASCFKLTKRDGESSLMQLKEEFRSYDALRREHDAQIVSIALESKLKISAEQWSSLLYGDSEHKSHMQSILDRLQPPNSFHQSIEDFKSLLSKNGDPIQLASLVDHFYRLANIDTIDTNQISSSENLEVYLDSTFVILEHLNRFLTIYKAAKSPGSGTKRITSTNHQFNYKQNLPHPNVPLIQSRQQPLLHPHPNLHHPHLPQTRYSSLIQ